MVKYCTIIGMKILKCFEEFIEEYAKKLEIENKTYLRRLIKSVVEYPEDFQYIIKSQSYYQYVLMEMHQEGGYKFLKLWQINVQQHHMKVLNRIYLV